MKIAILQLTRLGDILQSIPGINAYKRLHPEDEIHLIVRQKFSEAAQLSHHINKIIELPSKFILSPLIMNQPQIIESLKRTEQWLESLALEKYDKIINLSFSPLSSWISRFLYDYLDQKPELVGYSRTTDGFLAIPDDMSAYVYAQCGINKPNRFHMAEIYGTLLGVDLKKEDWQTIKLHQHHSQPKEPYITLHPRASNDEKSIPENILIDYLNSIYSYIDYPIILLGNEQDQSHINHLVTKSTHPKLINLAGQLNFKESASLINYSSLFIGPDSSLQNLASLTQTKTLFLGYGNINFWETGPRAYKSFILLDSKNFPITTSMLIEASLSLIYDKIPISKGYLTIDQIPCYQSNFLNQESNFNWELINFIYKGEPISSEYPKQFILALEKLNETNQLIIELLFKSQTKETIKNLKSFFERAEEIIDAIYELCEYIKPIIDWYKTEKIRINPGNFMTVLENTQKVHELLKLLINTLFDHYQINQEHIVNTHPI